MLAAASQHADGPGRRLPCESKAARLGFIQAAVRKGIQDFPCGGAIFPDFRLP